jgi:Tol biopolymer transport system component
MNKKMFIREVQLALILCLFSFVMVSSVQSQTPTPEHPRRGMEDETSFDRPPTEPTYRPTLNAQTPAAPRLAWSKVVYHSFQDNNNYCEIYLANDDGSGLVRLTNNSKTDISPRLNRGGTKIVYVSGLYTSAGSYEIYTINPDGTSNTRLTNNSQNDTRPSWSPDGSKIVFQSYRDGNWEIYVMNANGTSQTRLTNDTNYDGEPVWSPDGTKIAWTAYRNGGYRIWVMNANGSGAVQLSGQPYSEDSAFSPDGSQIAYDADGNGDGWQEIWLMNADGTNQHVVYTPPYTLQDTYVYSWSPDGSYIVYNHVYYIYQNNNYYWTDAYLKIISPTSSPVVEMDLLSGNLNWWPDWQTLDITAPTSTIQALPAQSPGPFTVSWSGSDTGGSGLRNYDIQVRDGAGGVWTDWMPATTATSGTYPGIGGHTYYFRSRARDNAFNLENWPANYDVVTTVEALPPVSAVASLPEISPSQVTISWSGSDLGGSGLKTYDIQSKDVTAGGLWTNWQTNTIQTSAIFSGTSTHIYAFRARAVDNAQNLEAWPPGDREDTKTMLVSFGLQGKVMDNTGNPVVGAVVDANPTPFQNPPSNLIGSYGTFVTTGDSTVSVNWSKNGYGTLPLSVFKVPSVQRLDVALPPEDNLVINPGLEFSGTPEVPWTGAGVVLPSASSTFHTGETSVLLGMTSGIHEPINLSQLGDPPSSPSRLLLKVEQMGVVHALWADSNIYYSRRTASGDWSPAVNVSQGQAFIYASQKLEMVIDNDGNVYVFWTPFRSGVTMARRDTNGFWSAPEVISGVDTCGVLVECGNPKVIADSNGILHAVWDSEGRILYSERAINGVWSEPLEIQKPNNGSNPFMGMDDNGVVHVVWTGGYNNLLYVQRSSSGVWSTPIEFASGLFFDWGSNYEMDMQVSHDGIVSVAWEKGTDHDLNALSDIFYSQRSVSGTWSIAENISHLPGSSRLPEILLGSDGIVHIIWVGPPGYVYHAFKPVGGSWSGAQQISNGDGYNPWYIDTAIDDQGVVHVVWEENYNVLYTCRLTNGWIKPVVISPTYYFSTAPPRIAVDSFGGAHFLWQNTYAFYMGPRYTPSNGNSLLSQTVTIPQQMTRPVLSFFYQLNNATTINGGRFKVQVTQGVNTTQLLDTTSNTQGWTHAWYDLTPWIGQEITFSFSQEMLAGQYPPYSLIDDITIGSASPDVWVGGAGSVTAFPASTVTLALAYGNQGIVPANGVILSMTLPDKLTFISADIPPTSINGQVLTWDLGTLAGLGGPFTINVTVSVADDAVLLSTLDGTAQISTTSAELETANNTIQTHTFVGAKVNLPMVLK